ASSPLGLTAGIITAGFKEHLRTLAHPSVSSRTSGSVADQLADDCRASPRRRTRTAPQSTGLGVARSLSAASRQPPCENFLYGFKAAPQGRSRRRHGGQAYPPADAPPPARPAPGGRRDRRRAPRAAENQ